MERSERIYGQHILTDILLTGIVAGVLYFGVNLAMFYPSEQLGLMGGGFLKFNLFAYSLAFWVLAFVVLSAIMHVIMYPLLRSRSRGAVVVGRAIVYFVVASAFLIGHATWWAYANTAPLIPSYVKVQEVKTSVMLAILISGLIGIGLALVRTRKGGERRGHAKSLGVVALACLVYVVVINLPIDYANLGGVPGGGPYPGRTRTVIFGVDAGAWNVVLPLVERGELPAFKALMDRGTFGYFDTYGQQYTPPSWTSIATGKAEDKHDVHTFANVSTDWKAAPIWSILSSAGKRVAVVNWECTWPPFEVDGAFISKIISPRPGSAYFSGEFSGYEAVADSILASWQYEVPNDSRTRILRADREMGQLRLINDDLFSKLDPDFAAYVYYSTDMLQHFFWKDMAPDLFTGKDWVGVRTDPAYSQAIREGWLRADGFLSDLMNTYGEYTDYVVVSDHGARPIKRRQVQLDMVALLEELGYLSTQDGEIRYESSICYPSKSGSPHFEFRLDINPAEYAVANGFDWKRHDELRDKIVDDLMAVRLEPSGKRMFQGVLRPDKQAKPDAPDISLLAARTIMEMPPEGSVFEVGGAEVSAERLLHFHPWSGRHRSRGILLAAGPAIKHRYSGAWTIDDPYTRVFRYTHGIYKAMDRFFRPLQSFHLVDEVTNLDVTPTLLYLFKMPVAEDMDGRVLTEMLEHDFRASNPLETVQTYRIGEILDLRSDPAEEQKIKERLRALGYIQ
jgi:predicted AlkP superfamily phosphohydrolase/phosphomutase/succinate dehydrogenase/fumarate reductase cytochrome b subunit